MQITDELVEHLERLSKLKLKKEEIESLKKDMENILEYVKLISEANVSGYEAIRGPFENNMVPRKDEVKEFDSSKVLKEAPSMENGLLKVSSLHGK